MENLIEKIKQWGEEKNITQPGNEFKQLAKTLEELGEVASALCKNDSDGFIDGIGDVLVTLILLCKIKNVEIDGCLLAAWEEIKDRTGKTENGVFIKDGD